jgi:hypothetical protein
MAVADDATELQPPIAGFTCDIKSSDHNGFGRLQTKDLVLDLPHPHRRTPQALPCLHSQTCQRSLRPKQGRTGSITQRKQVTTLISCLPRLLYTPGVRSSTPGRDWVGSPAAETCATRNAPKIATARPVKRAIVLSNLSDARQAIGHKAPILSTGEVRACFFKPNPQLMTCSRQCPHCKCVHRLLMMP